MKIGMLWFDDDEKRTFVDKVLRAAHHYSIKYERAATECHCYPADVPKGTSGDIGGIRIYKDKLVLPNNFWIGVRED